MLTQAYSLSIAARQAMSAIANGKLTTSTVLLAVVGSLLTRLSSLSSEQASYGVYSKWSGLSRLVEIGDLDELPG